MPTVIVTGASRGLGLSITKTLLGELGARVIALSRQPVPIESPNLTWFPCDITDEAAVINAVGGHSQIDGLILNAGTVEPLCRIGDETALSSWKSHFDVNFFSLVTVIKATLPALRLSHGRIVMVSSGAAVKGTAGWGPYNASKAAMNSLCRTIASEESSITSVAVRPGTVDTDMQAHLREHGAAHMSQTDYQNFLGLKQDGKLLSPELPGRSIAKLALFAPASLSGQFINWNDDLPI